MNRVLIVEDDDRLRRTLAINLQARKYEVHTAADGATALEVAASVDPDLVVLDLGLPDMDGVDVVSTLRRRSSVPVIILSARDSEATKVAALDAGADDYVTKPFGIEELLARVRAAVRRAAPAEDLATVETATLTIDLRAKRVLRHGVEVRLTPTEWHVLEALARSPGRLVPGRELLREVWGPSYRDETNYLRVYMAQLRRKLEEQPGAPRHLITEPGLGYRFEP
ncbi:response regulator transcription factor [Intrasporangium calvum]|uniref:Response regulator transcription factor n=1 Tax=Intrasporangium calvum TaxID=53358 RepID=A0ABT5GHE7_9MICO|nr:response regulator transcription factor [Intrasporangium calvum]MDC5697509.1 response regulator transcription factor [Intrasporangium calvum]